MHAKKSYKVGVLLKKIMPNDRNRSYSHGNKEILLDMCSTNKMMTPHIVFGLIKVMP